jgi:pantoate--beta-alanine ligase
MHLFTRISNLKDFISSQKESKKKIAFIPTMGALHQGHLSLIASGNKLAEISICSIYVNPSQFNNKEDLEKYPRHFERDSQLLEMADCDVLFLPSNEEIYPQGFNPELKLNNGIMDQVMEGKFRPGHFKGMLEVVHRLLDIVQPDFLLMGQKDFQQFRLVEEMIRQLNLKMKIIMGPTLREKTGLAMSSRNERLSIIEKDQAIQVYETLNQIKRDINKIPIQQIEQEAMIRLKKSGFKPEYVEIIDGWNLEKMSDIDSHEYIVVCVAAWLGNIRLIDNLIIKEPAE